MSLPLYDSTDNEVSVCTDKDFNVITLFTGKYYGNETLSIGYSIDNFSHIILTTEEINPKVLVAHLLPTDLLLTANPYKITLEGGCYMYIYKNTPNVIWVGGLNNIASVHINKIYGVKKP